MVQAYGQELGLKDLASDGLSEKDADKVIELAKALNKLAEFDRKQLVYTKDLSHYTDATILYQHILKIYEEALQKPGCEAAKAQAYQGQEAAYSGLAQIRTAMLAAMGIDKEVVAPKNLNVAAQLQKEIAEDKQVLAVLRKYAKDKVAELDALSNRQEGVKEIFESEKQYTEESKKLLGYIAESVRAFLAKLYQESEEVLGPAPCKYTVIGLGSMALRQMTPYSDLEFAILMEDIQTKQQLSDIRNTYVSLRI